MSDADLIQRIRRLGKALKRAARWQGSDIAVDGAKDDFVYELLCYITVAVASANHFTLTLTLRKNPATGKLMPLFPKKPGLKKNFSFLTLAIADGQSGFELCPGIFILDRHGKRRAPDINLLHSAAPQDPSYKELFAIWDAKYTHAEAKRLADTAVSDFVYTFEELGSPKPPSIWSNAIGLPAFCRSGLLTNGSPSTELDTALFRRQVSETSAFPKNPTTRP